MKRTRAKIISAIMITIIILGMVPITVYAATPSDVIIGNSYTLQSGNTLSDDLVIIGGNVNLMSGSTVNGSIFLIGGSLKAAGTVNGDITVLGGVLTLEKSLLLNGNLSTAGTSINREEGAQVTGEIYTEKDAPYVFTLPGGIRLTNVTSNNPIFGVAGFFLRLFLWTLVAMVVAMFIPAQLNRISRTALSEPLISLGLGLLTIIIGPILIVLLAITICLIPVSILGAFLLGVTWAYGLISLGYEVGGRLSGLFRQDWHPVIRAGSGTLLLMLVLNSLETIIPCVGWIPKALIGLLGIGAVLITQFGMKPYSSRPSLPGESSGGAIPA